MATRAELQPGQEVRVYMAYSGRVQPAWVVRCARKYVTITTNREVGGFGREFDIDTQKLRGDGSGGLFRTIEQQEARDRDRAVRDELKAMGISVTYGGGVVKRVPSTAEMEAIVETIRRMRGAEGTSLPG